jgi:hypothetical protein
MKLLIFKVAFSTFRLIISLPKKLREWMLIRILKKHTKFETWKLGEVTSRLAILAVYPGTTPRETLRRVLETLVNQDFSVLVIMNENNKNAAYLEILRQHECTVLIRPNIGRDFGAYQVAFNRIYKEYSDILFEKILLLNDTLYVTPRTQEFYENFISQDEFNCIYLNKQGIPHASSHSIILSTEAVYSDSMKMFWRNYYPSSDRLHTVFKGEFGVTHTLGLKYFRPFVNIEAFQKINNEVILTKPEILQIKTWNESSNHLGKTLIRQTLADKEYIETFTYCIENFQISNSLGLIVNRIFNIPLKLDLCKQGLITSDTFLSLLKDEGLTEEEMVELQDILNNVNSGTISPTRFRFESLKRTLTEILNPNEK